MALAMSNPQRTVFTHPAYFFRRAVAQNWGFLLPCKVTVDRVAYDLSDRVVRQVYQKRGMGGSFPFIPMYAIVPIVTSGRMR